MSWSVGPAVAFVVVAGERELERISAPANDEITSAIARVFQNARAERVRRRRGDTSPGPGPLVANPVCLCGADSCAGTEPIELVRLSVGFKRKGIDHHHQQLAAGSSIPVLSRSSPPKLDTSTNSSNLGRMSAACAIAKPANRCGPQKHRRNLITGAPAGPSDPIGRRLAASCCQRLAEAVVSPHRETGALGQ